MQHLSNFVSLKIPSLLGLFLFGILFACHNSYVSGVQVPQNFLEPKRWCSTPMVNPPLSLFDRIAANIEPDPAWAMLIIEEFSQNANWKRAHAILQQLTSEAVDYELVNPEYPAVVIFRLKPEDIRDAVLKLTEKGYNRLKAIDSRIS
jgi:hypothetical protein